MANFSIVDGGDGSDSQSPSYPTYTSVIKKGREIPRAPIKRPADPEEARHLPTKRIVTERQEGMEGRNRAIGRRIYGSVKRAGQDSARSLLMGVGDDDETDSRGE